MERKLKEEIILSKYIRKIMSLRAYCPCEIIKSARFAEEEEEDCVKGSHRNLFFHSSVTVGNLY